MSKTVRGLVSCLNECDSWLLLSVLILSLLGSVMVFSAASFRAEAVGTGSGPYYYLVKHLVRLALGVTAMMVLANLDYRLFNRKYLNWSLLSGGLLFILAPFVLMGLTQGGCVRWLMFFGLFPVQPLEFVKIALILFLAERLTSPLAAEVREGRRLGLILMPVLGLVIILALQPNFGNVVVISLVTLIVLFMAGVSLRWLSGLFTLLALMAVTGVQVVDKLHGRVGEWWEGLTEGVFGYQVEQSLIGLGAGGWGGQGLGASHQRFWFLPESHTDFIFSVLGEELGLLGTLGTITLFVIFAVRGLSIARRASDRFGQVTAAGLTSLIVLYVIANIGMTTGLLPVMGLPLPFLSYGGSALVTNLAAVGILLSIDRHGRSYQVWRSRWDIAC